MDNDKDDGKWQAAAAQLHATAPPAHGVAAACFPRAYTTLLQLAYYVRTGKRKAVFRWREKGCEKSYQTL